jgi:serine/threonine protein kinase
MTPEQYERAMDIFLAASELPAAEQASYIHRSSEGDETVRSQALRLLANDSAPDLLAGSGALRAGLEQLFEESAGSAVPATSTHFPETIGQYRVVGRIGSGGMGEVFEAQQDSPRRRVAIKLMRGGLHSEAMARRFRREVDFLGRLSHPGIAQVFEAGVTTIGGATVPYYVMELINGKPLTEHVEAHALSVKARLELVADICDTVQYAHQQGIIHRDLKPANIIVPSAIDSATQANEASTAAASNLHRTGQSARAREDIPRILDFGIARAIHSDGSGTGLYSNQTVATEAGQIIGTIPYMSPEQIRGHQSDIDTRTDVYALGVILFEVLTGKLPHETSGLSVVEASNVKLNSQPKSLSSIKREFRGDLDTIVAKALESEKNRRYASASELAADIRRYLNNEAISAVPATTLYQLRKFAKRNKLVVGTLLFATLALIGGIIGVALQARAATNERNIAVERTKVALRKTEVADAVSKYLFDLLALATPKGTLGADPLLIQAIERTHDAVLDDATETMPEARIMILDALGTVWRNRGDMERANAAFVKALDLCRTSLPPDDPRLSDTLNGLGTLRRMQGKVAEALPLLEEAVAKQRADPNTDRVRLGRNMHNLANAYIGNGDTAKARAMLDESLALHRELAGDESEVVALHLLAYARCAGVEGKWDEAVSQSLKGLELARRCVGPNHPTIVTATAEYANAINMSGDHNRALELFFEADQMAHAAFVSAPPHPILKAIRAKLVAALRAADRGEEADKLEKDILFMPSWS